MSKVKILATIKDNENILKVDTMGILNDNKIVYYENDTRVVVFINSNNIILERKNNEYGIKLEFNPQLTKEGLYDINLNCMQVELSTYTNEMIIKDNYIYIDYDLYMDHNLNGKFIYELIYEVIS